MSRQPDNMGRIHIYKNRDCELGFELKRVSSREVGISATNMATQMLTSVLGSQIHIKTFLQS